ncbi:MAG: 50S ribosomal protein L23 [Bacteroidales bacterium]|jgi:large subunit ribosomal protein L23
MEIIIKPVITEKMTLLTEKYNRYAFIVDKRANKIQIKNAVEKLYNVDVEDVNTMNNKGKDRTRYTKSGIIKGRTKSTKKAIVTVASGQVIDFYSNI